MNPSSYHYNYTPSEIIRHNIDHSTMTTARHDEDEENQQCVINIPVHQENSTRSNFADNMAGTILSSVLSTVSDDMIRSGNNRSEQKSLISVYDNSNEERTIGLIGYRNKRTIAFAKRLVRYGFSPILTDTNENTTLIKSDATDHIQYVPNNAFRQSIQTAPIVIIAEQPHGDIQHLIDGKLVIDSIDYGLKRRFLFNKHSEQQTSSTKTFFLNQSRTTSVIRAFGNISTWEIEHGTFRHAPVYIQQQPDVSSTTFQRLLKFIHDLNFSGTRIMNEYDYNNILNQRSFHGCVFPLITTLLVFGLALLVVVIQCSRYEEANQYNLNAIKRTRDFFFSNNNHTSIIFRKASSVTGTVSLNLLAILYLIRPILELIDFLFSQQRRISRKKIVQHEKSITSFNGFGYLNFVQRWLHSRRYLAWYSLTFALLHLLFLIFSQENFSQNHWHIPSFFIGVIAIILLSILAIVYTPWTNERLLWNEWRIIVSYVGPLAFLLGFIHTLLLLVKQWNLYSNLFNLTFISLLLPLCVIIVRIIVYAIIYPIMKLIDWLERRRLQNTYQKKHEQITETEPQPHVNVTTMSGQQIDTDTDIPLLK
ncbi:unnamed protein product [Didymodactylos carnosus]|uniref:Uncharacterized protein n=1 Tax=Didymodactylos carnosus TaxID=1234261 RepID=A0A814KGV3_9BILA|nr:unnamed protein product [Didymodactylos carnosus]CAF3820404.1 unnamed protein product [Didymodactylos carnosus]